MWSQLASVYMYLCTYLFRDSNSSHHPYQYIYVTFQIFKHHPYQTNQQPRSITDLAAAKEINDDDLVMELQIQTEQWLWVQMSTTMKNTTATKASFAVAVAAAQSFLLRRLWLGSVKDSAAMLGLLLFLFSFFFFKQWWLQLVMGTKVSIDFLFFQMKLVKM